MKPRLFASRLLTAITLLEAPAITVSANDILRTTGFTTCIDDSQISVTLLNIQYDRTTKQLNFDVAGTSAKERNVTASLFVTAYGKQAYQKDFNPCDAATKVNELCPGRWQYSSLTIPQSNVKHQSQQGSSQRKVYRMYPHHLPTRSRL